MINNTCIFIYHEFHSPAACKPRSQLKYFLSQLRTLKYLSQAGVILSLIFSFLSGAAQSAVKPNHRDIVYATVGGKELKLDLYLPADRSNPMLLVWVHGGAWRTGSKDFVPKFFVENGVAPASLFLPRERYMRCF